MLSLGAQRNPCVQARRAPLGGGIYIHIWYIYRRVIFIAIRDVFNSFGYYESPQYQAVCISSRITTYVTLNVHARHGGASHPTWPPPELPNITARLTSRITINPVRSMQPPHPHAGTQLHPTAHLRLACMLWGLHHVTYRWLKARWESRVGGRERGYTKLLTGGLRPVGRVGSEGERERGYT